MWEVVYRELALEWLHGIVIYVQTIGESIIQHKKHACYGQHVLFSLLSMNMKLSSVLAQKVELGLKYCKVHDEDS